RHDRRRVAAHRHEGAVADRDLAGVAGEDVEAEDGDEVDADPRRQPLVVAAEPKRQDGEDDGDGRAGKEGRQRGPHTLRTRLRPNSPDGLSSSTASKTPSASPPTTAPAGLSRPPSTAAANA